ncbi:hypothetical protein E2562_035285 [Oryza meyeriana var. granulata]|uniref:Uncharacterized protein n=1 Tax=Oryza meyeriana var. granulata TaxID=110450 RepID=A0A6G1F1P5_9ORYZ|nr:hypothetical protein E2562_035285 [Oryza meyeriana var. granulata]
MADLTGGGAGAGGGGGSAGRRWPLGFLKNAEKRKDGFMQLLLMAGILMMSLRSLGQKHRLRDLAYDNADLRREQDDLSLRMRDLQDALHRKANADESGALASHLRRIFTAHPATSATFTSTSTDDD